MACSIRRPERVLVLQMFRSSILLLGIVLFQTVAIAYIGYYVSEVVFGFSGVISTVVTGVMTSFFGRPFINDPKLLDDFWILLEHLLNTGKLCIVGSSSHALGKRKAHVGLLFHFGPVLFALGGVVWVSWWQVGSALAISSLPFS